MTAPHTVPLQDGANLPIGAFFAAEDTLLGMADFYICRYRSGNMEAPAKHAFAAILETPPFSAIGEKRTVLWSGAIPLAAEMARFVESGRKAHWDAEREIITWEESRLLGMDDPGEDAALRRDIYARCRSMAARKILRQARGEIPVLGPPPEGVRRGRLISRFPMYWENA